MLDAGASLPNEGRDPAALVDAIPDIIATLGRTVDAELRAQLKAAREL